MYEGKGAGLDEMVQGVGAGLDEKVQAKDTKNGKIHAKIVIPKAEYEDAKEQVKEDNAERNKDEGAGRSEMYKDEGAGRHEMNKAETKDTKHKAGTKPIVIPKAEYEDAKNGNIPAKPKKL